MNWLNYVWWLGGISGEEKDQLQRSDKQREQDGKVVDEYRKGGKKAKVKGQKKKTRRKDTAGIRLKKGVGFDGKKCEHLGEWKNGVCLECGEEVWWP